MGSVFEKSEAYVDDELAVEDADECVDELDPAPVDAFEEPRGALDVELDELVELDSPLALEEDSPLVFDPISLPDCLSGVALDEDAEG